MRVKSIIVILMLGMSMTFIHAQTVPGFSYSGLVTFNNSAKMNIHDDCGLGGNMFYGDIQNRTDFSVRFNPYIYVDYNSQPYAEYRILPGNTESISYNVPKDIRDKPYEWEISFEFYWTGNANLTIRNIWMNYYTTDWHSEEYKEQS